MKTIVYTKYGAPEFLYLREVEKSVIDRRYRMEETNEAHNYVDKGHKKGNVGITVKHTNNTN